MPETITEGGQLSTDNRSRMRRGRTERETCRLNGWGVGTRIVGDEGYGPTVLRITHFTNKGSLLALRESQNGEPVDEDEQSWTLAARDWSEVPDQGDPDWVNDEGKNPRCLAFTCGQRQDGRHSMWWDDYGTCSRAHAVDHYGEEALD